VPVTTDHGHLDEGGHGGDSPVERTVFVVSAELDVKADGVRESARLVDVAPTVLHQLGIGIDA
jgi:bisphosphoglycerate-independent phosphoglycerate mutase (AlkP superfamily)